MLNFNKNIIEPTEREVSSILSICYQSMMEDFM
jgi:hypothetical protein